MKATDTITKIKNLLGMELSSETKKLEVNADEIALATANLENGTIMGLEHVKYPVFGIQFHPESIDTQFGKKIIKNFLEL